MKNVMENGLVIIPHVVCVNSIRKENGEFSFQVINQGGGFVILWRSTEEEAKKLRDEIVLNVEEYWNR